MGVAACDGQGEAEGAEFIWPEEEEAQGTAHGVCSFLTGGYREDGARFFLKITMGLLHNNAS